MTTLTSDPRPLALVTGASRGIGLELARQFATHGFDLVINSEDDALEGAAADLRTTGATVTTARADLTRPDEVEQLYATVVATGRPLAAAALNAGVGQGRAFVDQSLQEALEVVDLNVRSTVHLAHLVLQDMAARRTGRVLFTSSIASTQPGPYQAVYNASKSFVQSFVEALQGELEDAGVTLTSLMPGPVDTDFFPRADLEDTRMGKGPKDTPADVAKVGFEALMSGRRKVVAASLASKAFAAVDAVLPDRVKALAHRATARPLTGAGRDTGA